MLKYIILLLVIVYSYSCTEEDKEVIIENPVLRLCITNTLKKDKDYVIYQSDVKDIKYLGCQKQGIYNVTGIENLINLENLSILGSYASKDFNEISELKKLKEFTLASYHDNMSHDFISNLSNLEMLVLFPAYTKSLSFIENLNLNSLEIFYDYKKLPENMLDSIGKVHSLERLYLRNNKIFSLDFLKNLSNLKILDLRNNDLDNLVALQNLINLEELSLIGNYKIDDLSPIKDLIKLKALAFGGLKVTDLSALENLVNIEVLHAYSNDNLSNISGIQKLIKLKDLELQQNNIVDISALENLVNLESLRFTSNHVLDISPLRKLIKLKSLNFENNPEATGGIALKNLVNLEELRIRATHINTFEFLENLTKIYEIDFHANKVTSLDGIEKAIHLKDLSLSSNYITNLSPLSELELYYLTIYDNCIVDFSPTEHIWSVRGNSIEDQRETCDIPED